MEPAIPAPRSRSLALPAAGACLVSAACWILCRGLDLDPSLRVTGPAVALVSLAGMAASLARAGRSPSEAAGWRWAALSCLGSVLQGVLILLVREVPWIAARKPALWILVTALYQLCGLAAILAWPWRLRSTQRRLHHILGAAVFCGSILVILWTAVDWAPLAGKTLFLKSVLATTSLRICLFGGAALYLLSDRPARWRGPLGWFLLSAVGGGAFGTVLYAFHVAGETWVSGPLAFVTVLAAFIPLMAAWSDAPVEPEATPDEPAGAVLNVVPHAAFALAALDILAHLLHDPQHAWTEALAVVGVLVPFLWRQVLLDRDLARANADLETRVAERTRDLEAARLRLEEEVSERGMAEEAQQRYAAHLGTLLNTLPDAVWFKDPHGRYRGCNRRFQSLLGLPEDEILGRRDEDILPRELAGVFRAQDLTAVEAGGPVTAQERLALPGGRVEHLESSRTPVLGPEGEFLGVLGVGRDIAGRLRLEEERRILERQMEGAQRLESLGGLAGGVAHDMNNVLGAIILMASAQEEKLGPGDPQGRVFGTIAKAAERGGRMVKGLLNFARQTPLERVEMDLNGVIREVAELLERTTLARIRLELRLDPALGPILGDAATLAHAFMNLCVNASDAMEGEGALTLETRALEGGGAEARVTDTGCGMEPEVLRRALDPFFTTKEVGKGTGLGLSMVYGVMRSHEGDLEILSEPGKGTCVILRFPGPSDTWSGS
ncbi:MAG TPA: ATP-binding protein [Holophaga sp.]|nr:ATP-binding protein [Holophaga sp.]